MKQKDKPPRPDKPAKKPMSISQKIGLFLLPTVMLLDLLVLFLSYNITYENNLTIFENQLRNAAQMTVQYCETYNLYDSAEAKKNGPEFDKICEMFDITYVFAEDIDVEKRTETYLAIGFGNDASQEAIDSRYPGVTVEGYVNNEQIEAYNGNKDGVILHEDSRFGDTLVCYVPCTRYFDIKKMDYVTYDKPVVIGTEITLSHVVVNFQKQFLKIAILTIVLTLALVTAFGVILYFKVSKPVRKISRRMSEYVTNREKEKHEKKLTVKGNDEFALMVRSFNTMTDEIDRYLDDIDMLTLDKHTRDAELNIARNIQIGLLQPDHFDSQWINLDAHMLPAKVVGGDLYDYQQLDDGRFFLVVADVSGKGISGALFMARALTLLHQFMLQETSPAKILEIYNDALTKRNPRGLFITTFLAVWDPLTRELTYSNAGHNFPYILSDKLIRLEDAHGVAAGVFEGETYENASIKLSVGDVLFLYTDGVNEAKNANDAFYSTNRLEEKLSECTRSNIADPLSYIRNDLHSFTQGAEQNDDITMLCLQIKPTPESTVLTLLSEKTQLPKIKEAILGLDVSDDLQKKLILAAEEIFINICSYAYEAPGEIELRICPDSRGAAMTFIDGGKPFDPTADLLDIDKYDHDHAIGGLGRFLTFSIAECYRYLYSDNKNILYLYFKEVDPDDHNENA